MFNLISGDWRFFWPENIKDFIHLPYAWDPILNTGIGQSALNSLWITSYLNFTAFFTKFGLSWNITGILFWFLPAIVISFFSASALSNFLFPKLTNAKFLAGLIYTLNTYFLLIFLGGQAGVALAYSLMPLVLLNFIKVINLFDVLDLNQFKIDPFVKGKFRIRNSKFLKISLIFGLTLSFILLFDPRFFYMAILSCFLYSLFNLKIILKNFKLALVAFFIAAAEVILLHSYWILPLIIFRPQALPAGFDSVGSLRFFSFANLENSISLLQPNWPENIFGKIYFMRPQFLLMPVLAYSSLLFITKLKTKNEKLEMQSKIKNPAYNLLAIKFTDKKSIIFFALLGLTGAFLGKGANPLFGQVYIFLFKHFLGFSLFRDPTKWYVFVAVAYSVLVSFTTYKIYEWVKAQKKFKIQNSKFKIFKTENFCIIIVLLYLVILIIPGILGNLTKIYRKEIPSDYIKLKELLVSDKTFSRTLWIPEWQRFGYFSDTHPAIGRGEVLTGSPLAMVNSLKSPVMQKFLEELSIKYIIVPDDSEREIFLSDRKYDEKLYKNTVSALKNLPFLKKIPGFNKLAVFELFLMRNRFYIIGEGKVNYEFINPTKYKIKIYNAAKGDILVFSEGFDKNWVARNSDFKISSLKFNNKLNSFFLSEKGNFEFEIYYRPQDFVNLGLLVSTLAVICLIVLLGFSKRIKFNKNL